MVDGGPDSFLARVEHGRQLCEDLGIADQLTSPVAPVPAYVYRHGDLHELPEGTMFGVPTNLEVLARSSLVSPDGVAAAAKDLVTPWPVDQAPSDISVGEVCRSRLGDEVTDLLIDPLLGSINASDLDRLSLRAAAPQLAAALANHQSLITGMADLKDKTAAIGSRDPNRPVFFGLPGGIATIIDRLVEELDTADLRLGSSITSLQGPDGTAAGGPTDGADLVILAVSAAVAARLLGAEAEAGQILSRTEYADVSQVVAELAVNDVAQVLDASGILFPRIDGRLMTACTWLSTKWAHYHRERSVLVRMSAGRFGDTRHLDLGDDELTQALLTELNDAVRLKGLPIATRVGRWRGAFPQYTPGHHQRVQAARAAATDQDPRIKLIGASYDGIGIPACIATARTTVARSLHG
jgi:oxygen-dependent protoporphyrinogen oxidase